MQLRIVVLPLLFVSLLQTSSAFGGGPIEDPDVILDPCRTTFTATDVLVREIEAALAGAEMAMTSLTDPNDRMFASAQVLALRDYLKATREAGDRLRVQIEGARTGVFNGRAVQAAEDLWTGSFDKIPMSDAARALLTQLEIYSVRGLAIHTEGGFRERVAAAGAPTALFEELRTLLTVTLGHKFYGIREGRLQVLQLPARRPAFP